VLKLAPVQPRINDCKSGVKNRSGKQVFELVQVTTTKADETKWNPHCCCGAAHLVTTRHQCTNSVQTRKTKQIIDQEHCNWPMVASSQSIQSGKMWALCFLPIAMVMAKPMCMW